nr:MAG TPA: hypothetical protein [Caudoviricetes sp.]
MSFVISLSFILITSYHALRDMSSVFLKYF